MVTIHKYKLAKPMYIASIWTTVHDTFFGCMSILTVKLLDVISTLYIQATKHYLTMMILGMN